MECGVCRAGLEEIRDGELPQESQDMLELFCKGLGQAFCFALDGCIDYGRFFQRTILLSPNR